MTKEPHADAPRADDVDETGPAAAGPGSPVEDAASSDHDRIPDAQPDLDPNHARTPDQPVTVGTEERRTDPDDTATSAAAPAPASADEVIDKPKSEVDELRNGLGELTRDLQRVTAEYANYRKRVDRDRMLVAEQATGAVLTQLLPVLDDLDRARNHGDLVGPFASVAEQLSAAVGKFGLSAFGDVGDPFDPTLHEAVAHTSSPDVTETACVEIMRRGYLLGDRLLRPALVAVADPE